MYSCDICSKSFSRRDNMLRHKNTMHEDMDSEIEDMESSDLESDTSSETTENEEEEVDPWESIIDRTFEECQEEFEGRVSRYREENGVDTNVAREKIYREMRPVYRKKMAAMFAETAEWVLHLLKDPVFRSIKKTVAALKDDEGYDAEEAWKYAIKKRTFLFDKILREFNPPQVNGKQNGVAEEVDGGQAGGGIRPWLNAGGDTPVQKVENWVNSELDRINNQPKISVIGRSY